MEGVVLGGGKGATNWGSKHLRRSTLNHPPESGQNFH